MQKVLVCTSILTKTGKTAHLDVQQQSLLTVTLSKDWKKMRQRFKSLAIVFYLINHEKDSSFNHLKYENWL